MTTGYQRLPPEGADGTLQWDLPTYPVNEYGLTVGSRITMNTPMSAWPDLMPTRFEGEEAYFLTEDMRRSAAGTPEEAIWQMRERREQGLDVGKKRYERVYAAEGETKLGKKRN